MIRKVTLWFIISLIIAGGLALFASSHPDGFEKAGEEVGYIDKAASYLKSPLPDYSFAGSDSWLSASAAGIIGVIITFGVFFLVGKMITVRNK